jgi:hypothetical protein
VILHLSFSEVDGKSLPEHLKRLEDFDYQGRVSDIKIFAENYECSVGMIYIKEKGI